MGKESSLTFVTSFISIYENDSTDKRYSVDWRFENFIEIAKTGIQFCVYVSPDCYDRLATLVQEFPNVKIMNQVVLDETDTVKTCKNIEYTLPELRDPKKDSEKYMFIMNTKSEFLRDAVEKNPWDSTHFAWIDFSISYIFKDKERTLEYLRVLSKRHFAPRFFAIPGCWDKLDVNNGPVYLNKVNWRFCGGFYLADRESMKQYCDLYREHLGEFMQTYKKLVWEVNFMAWLEAAKGWSPYWYKADHNDSIFYVPTQFWARCLDKDLVKIEYKYPHLENFLPSSASYLYHGGKHILNTRYVNYSYSPEGRYIIYDYHKILHSKNMCSILDDETMEPTSFDFMDDTTVGLPSKNQFSHGLEDMRLYEEDGQVKFVASNVNYVPDGQIRILNGVYDVDTRAYKECKVLIPPTNTRCEKNWIPLPNIENQIPPPNDIQPLKEGGKGGISPLPLIYTWNPYQLGKINPETNQLEIIFSKQIKSPEFYRVRGSTTFIEDGDVLIGVVHFSEEFVPRQYYHMLVTLDKNTLVPIKYSEPFCFQHFGVEFCIGFTIRNGKYIFWLSKKDNNAIMVNIDREKIDICFDIV
jgi:hypothetical protein